MQVPPGPMGLLLSTDDSNSVIIVHGFEPMPTGSIGIIERSGKVRPGDVLVSVNGTNLTGIEFTKAMAVVNSLSRQTRTLVFQSWTDFEKTRRLDLGDQDKQRQNSNQQKVYHHSNISCAVVGTRIVKNQTGAPQFAEYQINVAATRPDDLSGKVHRWITWRRYREFDELHHSLRKQYGWQMAECDLPPKRYFVRGFDAELVQQRLHGLDLYLTKVLQQVRGVADFHKPHGSKTFEGFLQYEKLEQPERPPLREKNIANQHQPSIPHVSCCKKHRFKRQKRRNELVN